MSTIFFLFFTFWEIFTKYSASAGTCDCTCSSDSETAISRSRSTSFIDQPCKPNSDITIRELRNLGTPVDQLMTKAKLNRMASEPEDDENMIMDCEMGLELENRNGNKDPNLRWYANEDGTYLIPFTVSPDYAEKERDLLHAAMLEIQAVTCIRYYYYKNANDLKGCDSINVTKDVDGCFMSGLGRRGVGSQTLNLQPPSSTGGTCMVKGIVIHELIHGIGFTHQQNTPGRDEYVTILLDNILKGKESQFRERFSNDSTSFGADYDFGSIMHYHSTAFSKNKKPTIEAKVPGVTFGQRKQISELDALKINKMYNCP